MSIKYPLKVAVYWGADLDSSSVAQELEFANEKQFLAWREGLDRADGWMGAHFVDNSAMYVNREGDIVQRKGKVARSNDNEVHVIWGDNPEPGERAETFKFDSPDQARFFKNAVMDYVGWTRYHIVPDASFRAYGSLAQALESLPQQSATSLKNYLEAKGYEEEDYDNEDLVFVRADGALVFAERWSVGDEPENIPLTAQQYTQRFNAAMEQYEQDSSQEFSQRKEDYLDNAMKGIFERTPEDAASAFAHDNELLVKPTNKPKP